jgi:hypothetical protein
VTSVPRWLLAQLDAMDYSRQNRTLTPSAAMHKYTGAAPADVGSERYRGATVVSDLGGDLVEVTLSASEQSHPYAPGAQGRSRSPGQYRGRLP